MRWPPAVSCEECGGQPGEGYVGPAVGDSVTFPNPKSHFICDSCARSSLALEPGELDDEMCITVGCTGYEHANVVNAPTNELPADASPDQAVAFFTPRYAERGWRVIGAELNAVGPATMGGHAWRVTFTPLRQLW